MCIYICICVCVYVYDVGRLRQSDSMRPRGHVCLEPELTRGRLEPVLAILTGGRNVGP